MSESTASANACPQCGGALPSSATAGLCPRCLMAEAMVPTQVEAEPAAQPPLPSEQIAPHFPQLEILECLGRGGMGVVYKARQKTLNRFVALKLLAPERVLDPRFAERFTREAQALAALNHPNIVTIHDFGQAGGFYYLLMEFVDGANLRQLLRARKFTPEEALAIVPPLCDALQFAHDRGIVHRDIKPENLLIDIAGRVKVADFGIAKMLGTFHPNDKAGASLAPDNATLTDVGTPGYSAPEQKTQPQRVDSRADIYSLGVVFYELLTGERPDGRLKPPSKRVQIDVRLDAVVLRALEKDPVLRFQQVSEVKTIVETIVQPSSNPPPVSPAADVSRIIPHKGKPEVMTKIQIAIASACALLLIAGTLVFASRSTIDQTVDYPHRGDARQSKGDFAGAIADYTKAIKLKPHDVSNYQRRGDAKQRKNDFAGAIADYTKAIELAPSEAGSYARRGDAKQGKNDFEGAIADYDKAIELAPSEAGSYDRRGDAKQRKNDFEGAIADYNKAIELVPSEAGSYIRRAGAKQGENDFEGAIADYNKAIELAPDDAGFYVRRAGAKQGKNDFEGAIADYTTAIELAPHNADTYLRRGLAKQAKGDLAGADADRAKAIELKADLATH